MSASAQITDNGSALGGRLGSMSLTRQMSRQMSIYSLTLDEFQSALGEPAKNFGSMNMDELLKNIWTAEESQAMAALFSNNDPASTSLLPRQPSIQRQNSVTLLPLPQALSKKTVEEVWKDIAGGGGGEPSSNGGAAGGGGGGGAGEFGEPNIQAMKPRQSTYGEMTLEDFLVKAGVMTADPVADPVSVVPVVHPFSNNQHYGGGGAGGGGGGAVVTTSGYGGVDSAAAAAASSRMMNMNMMLEQKQQNLQPILGAMTGLLPSSGKKEPIELNDPVLGIGLGPSNFSAGASSSNGYITSYNNNNQAKQQAEWMDSQYKSAQQQQLMQLQAAAGYMNGAGTSNNGLGIGGGLSGYGPGAIVSKEGSPGSPLSDAPGYGLSPNGNYGLDVPLRGRKRILDAPLEKIVERRQRRMIKNRESAARSRARKQAYTVELEAEVTQLKEENMRLRKMQVRVQEEENSKKKKQVLEVIAPMTRHLPKMLRRTVTGPW